MRRSETERTAAGVGGLDDLETVAGGMWTSSAPLATTGVELPAGAVCTGEGRVAADMGRSARSSSSLGTSNEVWTFAVDGLSGVGGIILVAGFCSGVQIMTVGTGVSSA